MGIGLQETSPEKCFLFAFISKLQFPTKTLSRIFNHAKDFFDQSFTIDKTAKVTSKSDPKPQSLLYCFEL
jgi:hypothetical protein